MTIAAPQPHAQSKYQVRFDWGRDGAARIAGGADIVVWVDVLSAPDAAAAGVAAAEALSAAPTVTAGVEIIGGGLRNAAAVASHVLESQVRLGRRVFVAVIAAGATGDGGGDRGVSGSGPRFAVEDLLGSGAVIDALAAVGLDYCSPEAAAACAAFTGLRGAVTHLATASASAQELLAAGVTAAEIRVQATQGSSDEVPVLLDYPA